MRFLSCAILEQIVQASVHGLLLVETQGHRIRIRYVNPAYEKLSGYTQRELVGNAWSTHFDGECAFSDAEELNRVIMRGLPMTRRIVCLRKDGTPWESNLHLSRIGGTAADGALILAQHVPVEGCSTVAAEPSESTSDPAAASDRISPSMAGMLSAGQFAALLSRDLAIARRHERRVRLILFEIVEFDVYRDTFGALAAESCARMVGTQILGTFGRSIYPRARLDEMTFAVAVQERSEESAARLARIVTEKTEKLRLPNPRGRLARHVHVASVCIEACDDDDVAGLIARARCELPGELAVSADRPALRSIG